MRQAAPRLPAGFLRLASGPVALVADAGFVSALEQLGLLEPGGLARARARAEGPSGRGRVAVLELEGHGERLCLRPLRRGGWLAPWLPGAFGSLARPLAELAATATLHGAGAPVPRPLLAIGERRGGGAFDTAMGTVFAEGSVDAFHFLDGAPGPARLLQAAASAGSAVRRFHDAGGRHADLHLKNLLLCEREGRFETTVIDLDRARVVARVSPRARLAELMRLYRSLVKWRLLERVGPRGCARFFGAYVDGDRALRQALRAGLTRERLLLAIHGLHYRKA
jgi:3-deoxy-D-manno-octulosonic acid kinase